MNIAEHCIDKFDSHYTDSCGVGAWAEKWYFDHLTGLCHPFWYDGCLSTSQNIFNDRETSLPSSTDVTSKDAYRCLEEKSPGMCKEKYPAYFYNKETRRCEPFAYSGCAGNGNRFLTLQQCESICNQFRKLSAIETDCYLPLSVGSGRGDMHCQKDAGFRYYYNKDYGRCGKFWYFGCGGNGNRFFTYSSCERVCRRSSIGEPREPSSKVCFLPREKGECAKGTDRSQQRWWYNSEKLMCETFTFSGCGGNANRFASLYSCKSHCDGLIRPKSRTFSRLANHFLHYKPQFLGSVVNVHLRSSDILDLMIIRNQWSTFRTRYSFCGITHPLFFI
ncbi:unnamed protein product [Anisakis simplex]|uniref:Putative kunitz-type protease inhibitor (inferred by orthology to a S. mansoni protein) n=1 Tax=Anisakis simplex TaxID=6269 RepID=A0A0M3J1P5_ANISI|nr:unnamed protein product [Anisakis simplex]